MDKTYFINQSISLTLVISISLIFTVVGLIYSKKYQGIDNYLTANRNIGFFSLTTTLIASALGAWILFGPASAATWGGIGAVIGYALGTAFPMIFLISKDEAHETVSTLCKNYEKLCKEKYPEAPLPLEILDTKQ